MKNLKNLKKKAIFLGFLFILYLINCAPFLTTENNAIKNEIQEDSLPKLNAEMLNLTTPENKTYFEPTNGHYPDPNSFTHEATGTMGANIDFVDTFWRSLSITYLWARIDPEWYGHKNYLSLIDSQGGGGWLYVRHEGFDEVSGEMEWYWGMNINEATHDSYFRLMYDGTQAFEIRMDGGSFAYTGTSSSTLTTFEANTWYHHRLLFDCGGAGNGRFTWIISHENGTEIDRVEDIEFTNNVASVNMIHIETPTTHVGGCRANFDAFGFSWEGYQLGDNLNEGLLLSFTPNDLDWMAYSLDGQDYVTILGNTTIPFPEDGQHTIQVFGNDSLGIKYISDSISFSIDTMSPDITIDTPIHNDFFGTTAPDFELSIDEMNLDSIWYTLDNGLTNITSGSSMGTINQTEWEKFVSEEVIIEFYANDSVGHIGYAARTVLKDINAPSSSIHFVPYQVPNIVNKSTTFTLNANDGTGSGVSVIRYKINDSGWSDYSVSFDLSSYEPGHYLISYYSVDNIGNIETENSIEVILVKKPSKPPAIPGFDIFLMISIICVVSIVLFKRRYKSINK